MNRSIVMIVALTFAAGVARLAAAEEDHARQQMGTPCLPDIQASASAPQTFATHTQFASYGFLWGPSDGNFGAIPRRDGTYSFFGTGAAPPCRPASSCEGAFTFRGTLDHVTGGEAAKPLFGPRAGPVGWIFDKDYAGGGQVVRFDDREGHAGWLMSFHGEYHWKNFANNPGYRCFVGNTKSQVPCFYSSIGLAVSLNDGLTFNVVGQILQPSQPLSKFVGSASNMPVGYGSLLVADERGRHIENPPRDARNAYFYLIFSDQLAAGIAGVGACAGVNCMGVARARYDDVIRAALSDDPHRVASVFHKYDATSQDAWAQPGTGDTPDLSGTAGSFTPLWTDGGAYQGSVIYDRDLNVYLAVYQYGRIYLRASQDLIHWTGVIGMVPSPDATYYYPTFIGETGDPTIAGRAPRVYFSSFPVNAFPNWAQANLKYVQLALNGSGRGRLGCVGEDR